MKLFNRKPQTETHRCTFTEAGGVQFLTFGALTCSCGRTKPYQIPTRTLIYSAFRKARDEQPGSQAEAFFFFNLPIPEENRDSI
jgi:hypothetical protein